MPDLESVTKEEVKEAFIRLGASILGLKQGWSGADVTRLIDLDVGVIFRFVQPLLVEPEPEPAPAPAPKPAPEPEPAPPTIPDLDVAVVKKKAK